MTTPVLTWECGSCGRPTDWSPEVQVDGLCPTCRTPAPRPRQGVGAGWGIRNAETDIALTAAIARKTGAQLHAIGWRPVTDPGAAPYPGVPPTHVRIEWFAIVHATTGPGFQVTENSIRLPHTLRLRTLLVETLRTLGVTSVDTEIGTGPTAARRV